MSLSYSPFTRAELRATNERTGANLNLVEGNVLRALSTLEGPAGVSLREAIPLLTELTGYTEGQVRSALASCADAGMIEWAG